MNLRFISTSLLLLAALAGWPGAQAQSQAPAASNSASSGPSASSAHSLAEFRSSLESYQPYTDEKIISWKDANDRVGRIGGWRAYAKEAQQPSGGSAPPAAKPADPHAGRSKPAQAKP